MKFFSSEVCFFPCFVLYVYFSKLNCGYQISSIFIASPDTGYQFIYLLYLIWSRNASAITRTKNTFCSSEIKWPTKTDLDRNKIDDPGVLTKQLLYLGLPRASLVITSYLARPRRIIVKHL